MEIKKCIKEVFSVIGKEGSTNEAGNIGGIWGAMSDFSHSFKPWEENYSPGYEYLYVKWTGLYVLSNTKAVKR